MGRQLSPTKEKQCKTADKMIKILPHILILITALSACVPFLAREDWRYRMIVEVETPEGIKTGSAVREVTVTASPKLTPEMTSSQEVEGEAVVVNLGERGVLFVLMDGATMMPTYAFGNHGQGAPEGMAYFNQLEGSAPLPLMRHPRMVTFDDMNDPTSVRLVYDAEICERRNEKHRQEVYGCVKADNFAEIYGDGVALKSITIEMTHARVTKKIEKWLPWLSNYKNLLFDGRTIHTIKAENRLANSLGAGSFAVNTLEN